MCNQTILLIKNYQELYPIYKFVIHFKITNLVASLGERFKDILF